MKYRWLILFAATIVLQGASTLRSCEWGELLAGSSCHDEQMQSLVAFVGDDHSPVSDDNHCDTCLCTRAKVVASQNGRSLHNQSMSIDLFPPVGIISASLVVAGPFEHFDPTPPNLSLHAAVNLPLIS